MARETVIASRQRQQQNAASVSQPQLSVTAQIVAPRDNSQASWNALKSVLTTGASVVGQSRREEQQNAAQWQAQGAADQLAGKVNPEFNEHDAYAAGVTHAAAITQGNAALADVFTEADSNIDHTSPINEQMAQFDALVQKQLAPLLGDPTARKALSPLIQDAYQRFAGSRVAGLQGDHRASAADAMSAQIAALADGADENGTLTPSTIIGTAAGVLGRSAAWENYIDRVAQLAESEHDDRLLALIPKTYTDDNGVEVASPINGVKAQARIAVAKARNAAYADKIAKPQKEWENTVALAPFEDRIDNGLPIALTELEPFVKSGVLSREAALSYVNRAQSAMKTKNDAALKWNAQKSLLGTYAVDTFRDIVGVEGGPKTASEAGQWNSRVQNEILAATVGNGKELSGPEILGNQQALQQTLLLSKKMRSANDTLKGALNNIDLSNGETVVRRLDAYRAVKAMGLTSQYFTDDEQAAVFESALSQRDLGAKDEDITRNIARYGDPVFRASQRDARAQIEKKVNGLKFDTIDGGTFFGDGNTSLKDLDPASRLYASAKIKELAGVYAGMGQDAETSVRLASTRFKETNQAVEVNGKALLVPTTSGDPRQLKAVLEWAQPMLAKKAKADGLQGAEGMTLRFYPPSNGNDVQVRMIDAHGIGHGPLLNLGALTDEWRKTAGAVNFEQAQKEAIKGRAYRDNLQRVYSPDNPFATKMLQ